MDRPLTFSLHPFAVPLVAPLRLASREYHERQGVLLRVEKGGVVGWGEAAPLPGFSPDTFDEARHALEGLDARLLDDALDGFETRGRLDLDAGALPPAARAGAEGALLGLVARRRGVPVACLLSPGAAPTVQINGLLPWASAAATLDRARALAAAGYRAVKLKVGGAPVADDARLVRAVRDALGPDVQLRLDANRAWSRADALAFARAIGGVALEYVEEPVADLADLAAVAEWMPVALDETLVGALPGVLDAHPYARAAVLKPMLLGGVWTAWRWAAAARARGLTPVVSAAFETGVGMRLNVALAAALGGDVPAGLDPYAWIARDVLPHRLALDGPTADALSPFSDAVLP